MRDFFKSELKNLILTGIRQMEFLSEEQISLLLLELCRISEKHFNYIPFEAQQREIKRQIVEDPEFNGLNTRWLFKVLTRISDQYWRTKNSFTEEELTPAPREVADKYIEEFKKNLEQIGAPKLENGIKKLREESGFSKGISQGQRKEFLIEDGENKVIVAATSEEEALKAYQSKAVEKEKML